MPIKHKKLGFVEYLYATTLIFKFKTNGANFSNLKNYLKYYYDQFNLL